MEPFIPQRTQQSYFRLFFQQHISVETERTIKRASEFCKPKFLSEPSKFRAFLNLISIPYSWDRAELRASEQVWQPKFSSEPSEFLAKFSLCLNTTTNYVDWYEHVKAKNCNNDPSSSFLTQGNSRKCWLVYLLLWAWDSRGNDSPRPWNYCWINWLPVVIKAKEENLLQLR